MFGHHDDVITKDQKSDANVPLQESAIDALTTAPDPVPPTDNPEPAVSAPAIDESEAEDLEAHSTAGSSLDGFLSAPASSSPSLVLPTTTSTAQDNDTTVTDDTDETPEEPVEEKALAAVEIKPSPKPAATANPEDLLSIKQEALQELSPLVDTLDLKPEEKFKTLMMLIQASDDQKLVSSAYEVAKQIKDEKTRAQALLDIVNEINYFTSDSSAQSN